MNGIPVSLFSVTVKVSVLVPLLPSVMVAPLIGPMLVGMDKQVQIAAMTASAAAVIRA